MNLQLANKSDLAPAFLERASNSLADKDISELLDLLLKPKKNPLTFIQKILVKVFRLDVFDDNLKQVRFVSNQGRMTGRFTCVLEQRQTTLKPFAFNDLTAVQVLAIRWQNECLQTTGKMR